MDLDSVISVIKSLVVIRQGPYQLAALNREYREMVGENLNYRQFGYSSLENLLSSIPEMRIKPSPQGPVLVVHDEKISHVADLVQKQRKSKKRVRPNKMGKFRGPPFGSQPSYQSGNSQFRKLGSSPMSQRVYPKSSAPLRSQASYTNLYQKNSSGMSYPAQSRSTSSGLNGSSQMRTSFGGSNLSSSRPQSRQETRPQPKTSYHQDSCDSWSSENEEYWDCPPPKPCVASTIVSSRPAHPTITQSTRPSGINGTQSVNVNTPKSIPYYSSDDRNKISVKSSRAGTCSFGAGDARYRNKSGVPVSQTLLKETSLAPQEKNTNASVCNQGFQDTSSTRVVENIQDSTPTSHEKDSQHSTLTVHCNNEHFNDKKESEHESAVASGVVLGTPLKENMLSKDFYRAGFSDSPVIPLSPCAYGRGRGRGLFGLLVDRQLGAGRNQDQVSFDPKKNVIDSSNFADAEYSKKKVCEEAKLCNITIQNSASTALKDSVVVVGSGPDSSRSSKLMDYGTHTSIKVTIDNSSPPVEDDWHDEFQPSIFDYQLIGDDFLLDLSERTLNFTAEERGGVKQCGLCVSGQTIDDCRRRIEKGGDISDQVIVMIGLVDILQGSPLKELKENMEALLETIRKQSSSIMLVTLPVLPSLFRFPKALATLIAYNNWLVTSKNRIGNTWVINTEPYLSGANGKPFPDFYERSFGKTDIWSEAGCWAALEGICSKVL